MVENEEVTASSPNDSFQKIVFEQQRKGASHKNSRSMRWHPVMIKWCLYLKHLLSKTYETLRNSRCIALPSQQTLRDYTHFVRSTRGFSKEVDAQLIRAANIDKLKEWEKCVSLVMGEMYNKEDLVYNKHSGQVIGFANLTARLLQFEHAIEGRRVPAQRLAMTMFVFMVRAFSFVCNSHMHNSCALCYLAIYYTILCGKQYID